MTGKTSNPGPLTTSAQTPLTPQPFRSIKHVVSRERQKVHARVFIRQAHKHSERFRLHKALALPFADHVRQLIRTRTRDHRTRFSHDQPEQPVRDLQIHKHPNSVDKGRTLPCRCAAADPCGSSELRSAGLAVRVRAAGSERVR